MLSLSRKDLAASLAAYGEQEASIQIESLSKENYERIGEIGFKHALAGKHWLLAGCLAAIEVLEGAPRELKRKHRVLGGQDSQHHEPDSQLADVYKWFEAYSGGARVQRREVLQGLASALQPHLPGYRYFSSQSEFRRSFERGTCYIRFERGKGVVQLRFGVLHTDVENIKGNLFGKSGLEKSIDWTISMFTPNIGPNSPHWQYPIEPSWPIFGSEGLARASAEIISFVEDVVLPYLERHQQPERIRETFINTPRKALSLFQERTIFAIDYLLRNRLWLEEDYVLLTERFRNFVPERKKELMSEFAMAVERWDDAL